MAKSRAAVVKVQNLCPGRRDFPMKSGASVYLPPKGLNSFVEIPADEISETMWRAVKKGVIAIADVEVEKGGTE